MTDPTARDWLYWFEMEGAQTHVIAAPPEREEGEPDEAFQARLTDYYAVATIVRTRLQATVDEITDG